MSDAINGKPPVSFWIIAGVALVWNLIGVMIFYMQVSASPEDLAQYYNETELAFLTSIPAWATAANAIAVIAGVLGCAFLLMRKIWAVPMFIISLLGIVVQDIHAFAIADGIAVWGAGAAVLPLVVLVIGVGLILYSRIAREKHWIE
jgi:archaellum biogenesis protein FlaJ (TadC family)